MNVKIISVRIISLFVVIASLLNLMTFSISADSVQTNEIKSVRISNNSQYIELTVALSQSFVSENKNNVLFLFELLPYQSISEINSLSPVISDIQTQSDFTLNLALYNENSTRLFSSFILALKISDNEYTPITEPEYITNAESLAKNTQDYPQTASIKGLQVQMTSDAQELGINHTIISLSINDYLIPEKTENSLEFVYNNKTFYIDLVKISLLDRKIKIFTQVGINIYLNIFLMSDINNSFPFLYYENTTGEASVFAINVNNKDGFDYYCAFLDFICRRYMSSEQEYGFAPNIILGYEVNSNRKTNSMGEMPLEQYIDNYIKSFRITAATAKSVYKNARVYISLSNKFNLTAQTDDINTSLDYSGKSFLDLFNSKIKEGGNIQWNLAINPYNSEVKSYDFWSASDDVSDNDTTKYITMKNIDVITKYMSQAEFMYGSDKRSVIIGEYGASCTDNSEDSQRKQAAAFAYAYYKAEATDGIDAFIYHRHVDYEKELGQNYGLWSRVDSSSSVPDKKKLIYPVFKNIDTISSESECAFALNIIGASSWSDIILGFNPSQLEKRVTVNTVGIPEKDIDIKYTSKEVFDISKNSASQLLLWDNLKLLQIENDENGESYLTAQMFEMNPDEYSGFGSDFEEQLDLSETNYISVNFMPVVPDGVETVSVMLRLYTNNVNGKQYIYEGVAQLAAGRYSELNFKISEFTNLTGGKIDGIKIWVKPYESSGNGAYTLNVKSVLLKTEKKASVFFKIVKTVFITIFIAAIIFGIIVLALYIRVLKMRKEYIQQRKHKSSHSHHKTDIK